MLGCTKSGEPLFNDFRDKLVENYVIAWRDNDWRFVAVATVSIDGFQWNSESGQWEAEEKSD
ncbi:hypothetical protein GCM10010277_85330 [Streptomyces longisporoflavus]|nr:hypothetical protein GCM10010277_85330 [Streptomyces longisporoflavus]